MPSSLKCSAAMMPTNWFHSADSKRDRPPTVANPPEARRYRTRYLKDNTWQRLFGHRFDHHDSIV
jgi:hypothetical protein